MEMINTIINGDALETVKGFQDSCIDCIITSPPYWQLRDYGFPEQWGLEPTYKEYLEHLWSLMDELWRILKPEGTVWINLGDTYGSTKTGNTDPIHKGNVGPNINKIDGLHKCLMLIPHRFAIGCIDRGWIIRNDIIWAKPNGMPESVTDRFSKKHEYFFFMVKSKKYYFDLDGIRDPYKQASIERSLRATSENNKWVNGPDGQTPHNLSQPKPNRTYTKYFGKRELDGQVRDDHDIHKSYNQDGKNPGSVSDFWDIPTQPSKKKHFASYNHKLIDKPIIAGCPEGGIILDPFAGTGTTLARAIQLNRNAIGIDGNKEYCGIAQKRIQDELDQLKIFT